MEAVSDDPQRDTKNDSKQHEATESNRNPNSGMDDGDGNNRAGDEPVHDAALQVIHEIRQNNQAENRRRRRRERAARRRARRNAENEEMRLVNFLILLTKCLLIILILVSSKKFQKQYVTSWMKIVEDDPVFGNTWTQYFDVVLVAIATLAIGYAMHYVE